MRPVGQWWELPGPEEVTWVLADASRLGLRPKAMDIPQTLLAGGCTTLLGTLQTGWVGKRGYDPLLGSYLGHGVQDPNNAIRRNLFLIRRLW